VEVDELWSFIGKKEKRVRPEDDQNLGDAYTFVAIERNTKLVLNIAMGKRDQQTTYAFIEGLRDAIRPGQRFQITSDGFAAYKNAIPDTFGDVDYAMLIKVTRPWRMANGSIRPLKCRPWRWSQFAAILIPTHLHFNHRTLEPQRPHGNTTVHPLDEWLLKEMGEPLGRSHTLVHVLQLLPDSQVPARDACDGGGYHRDAVVHCRSSGVK
jgi:IS1 family transposase